MKLIFHALPLALAVSVAAYGQAPAGPNLEFEAASITAAAPQTGHFRLPGSSKGGPGTADPTLFRCTNCDLAFLITKAFALERFQFPGQASLPDTAFDISARVAEGATAEQFAVMLQNLLKERFGLAFHYEQKQVQGYDLVVGKNGAKLKESVASAKPAGTGTDSGAWHGSGGNAGHDHTRPGLMVFNGQARYRGDGQTTADLARMLANQLARPVEDHTGLTGKYDITLSWSDDGSHAASHFAGGPGAGDHADHGGAQGGAGSSADSSGPTLIGALQAQLGLRLEARKTTGRIFIIDRVEKSPTAN